MAVNARTNGLPVRPPPPSASLAPRRHHQHHGDRHHVKEDQPQHHRPHRARDRRFWLLGFPGHDRDAFDPHVAGDDERQRQPDAPPSVGEKPAGTIEQVAESDGRSSPQPRDHGQSGCDERHNREHLHQRKPVLDFTEEPDLRGVDRDQRRRDGHNPDRRRHMRKPEREIDGDRGHFRADRQDLHEGVGGAH